MPRRKGLAGLNGAELSALVAVGRPSIGLLLLDLCSRRTAPPENLSTSQRNASNATPATQDTQISPPVSIQMESTGSDDSSGMVFYRKTTARDVAMPQSHGYHPSPNPNDHVNTKNLLIVHPGRDRRTSLPQDVIEEGDESAEKSSNDNLAGSSTTQPGPVVFAANEKEGATGTTVPSAPEGEFGP